MGTIESLCSEANCCNNEKFSSPRQSLSAIIDVNQDFSRSQKRLSILTAIRQSNPVFTELKLPDKTQLQPIVPSDINLIESKHMPDDISCFEPSDSEEDENHKKYFFLYSDKTLERVTE